MLNLQRADDLFEKAVKHWNALEYNQAEALYKQVHSIFE